jgi:hypothetical protein
MKNIFLTTLALFFALPLFPQVDSIYTKGTQWIYVLDFFYEETFYFDGDILIETITGDTIVDGVVYKKIEETSIYISDDEEVQESQRNIYRGDLLRYTDGKYLRYYTEGCYRNDYKKNAPEKFLGDDHVMYDVNLKVGDKIWWDINQTVVEIGDTVFEDSPDVVRKYWRHNAGSNRLEEEEVYEALNHIWWIEGIGRLSMPYYYGEDYGGVGVMLMCCINANGDTIYRNKKYVEGVKEYMRMTGIRNINTEDITIAQANGECIVTLPNATKWSATLYNSNGIAVARKAGEGSEIILPAESKGVHILVLNIDGKQYTKKAVIK